MKSKYHFLLWLPLIALILLCFFAFYFHLSDYFNFENLKQHHKFLSEWRDKHYLIAVFIFMLIYILAVISSTPIPVFLNLVSGFFFGLFWGTLYVLVGATMGAVIVFYAVNTTLGQWLKDRASPSIAKMRKGIHQNAFNYLLVLRMTPLFPIWLVNIAPAILNVPFRIFFLTTLIGTIPGSFFYVAIGHGLTQIIDTEKHLSFRTLFTPAIFISIIILTALSFLPVLFKIRKKKKR